MKKIIFITFSFLFLIFIFIQCQDNSTNPIVRELTPLEKQVVSSSGEFGFKLFKSVNSSLKGKNVFISPLSVSMALGMALNGAAGSTYDSLQSALELSALAKEQINESYKSLIDLLTQIDTKVQFDIANSIWYDKQFNFEQKFIDVNKKYFNAEVQSLDFNNPNSVNIINNWVNNNTNGKIKKILEKISDEAIMFLINAITLKVLGSTNLIKKILIMLFFIHRTEK